MGIQPCTLRAAPLGCRVRRRCSFTVSSLLAKRLLTLRFASSSPPRRGSNNKSRVFTASLVLGCASIVLELTARVLAHLRAAAAQEHECCRPIAWQCYSPG